MQAIQSITPEIKESPNLDQINLIDQLESMKRQFQDDHKQPFNMFMKIDSANKQMINDFIAIRAFCSDNNLELAEIEKSLHPETT
jgi:hypothetical protein